MHIAHILEVFGELDANRQKPIYSNQVLKDDQTAENVGLSALDMIVCELKSTYTAATAAIVATSVVAGIIGAAFLPAIGLGARVDRFWSSSRHRSC